MVGNNIRLRRERLGVSQADLAKHLGVTSITVCLWENGKVKPNKDNLEKIAAFLSCDIEDLQKKLTPQDEVMVHIRIKKAILTSYRNEKDTKRVRAVRYSGRNMDADLLKRFPDEFTLAYVEDYPSLTIKSTDRCPYSGDYIVFSYEGNKVEGHLSKKEFERIYKKLF